MEQRPPIEILPFIPPQGGSGTAPPQNLRGTVDVERMTEIEEARKRLLEVRDKRQLPINPSAYMNVMVPEQDDEFDRTIGQLDFILSKLMIFAREAENKRLSEPNRQTLKHHAEDMEAAAKAIYKRLGIGQEGTPQPG